VPGSDLRLDFLNLPLEQFEVFEQPNDQLPKDTGQFVAGIRPDTQSSTGWRWSPRLKIHVLRPALDGRG
jgi:hypothetical protein